VTELRKELILTKYKFLRKTVRESNIWFKNSNENILTSSTKNPLNIFTVNSLKIEGKNPKKLEKVLIVKKKVIKTKIHKKKDINLPPACVILENIKKFL
jgi:hypothetical protein